MEVMMALVHLTLLPSSTRTQTGELTCLKFCL